MANVSGISSLNVGPSERRLLSRFAGDECLYRDHRGKRVVCDVEGSGYFDIEPCESLGILVDGAPFGGLRGSFREGLLVDTGDFCDVDVRVSLGRSEPPAGPVVEANSIHRGAGWVVSSSGPVVADDTHDPEVAIDSCHPVPFFCCARSGGTMRIIPAKNACVVLASFQIGDSEALSRIGWSAQNMSEVRELSGSFKDGTPHSAMVASHLNRATWKWTIPGDHHGLVLRRTYDSFHGRQRTRVIVNGTFAGWWYAPRQNRDFRWAIDWFGIDASLTCGSNVLQIELDPPAGSPLWSVSAYELWAI